MCSSNNKRNRRGRLMQVFKFNRLNKGRALFLKGIVEYLKQSCFITIGKYTEWENETQPPDVTEFTSTDEVIIYKRPRLIMLATKTNCGGISCGSQTLNNEKYYLIDPNSPDLVASNANYIYIEGDIRYLDYTCAYFRTSSIVIGAEAPTLNKPLFKPEDMLNKGEVYLSTNHTRITREDNQRHLIKQLIEL
jgi:hypothetical protein